MSLINWNDEIFRPFGLVNKFFTDSSQSSFLHPSIDVKEDDEKISVIVEIPGIKKEDIEIELKGNYLTISGKKV